MMRSASKGFLTAFSKKGDFLSCSRWTVNFVLSEPTRMVMVLSPKLCQCKLVKRVSPTLAACHLLEQFAVRDIEPTVTHAVRRS